MLGYDTACKVNPPLRDDEDLAALREALADGTIDSIATDHAPHSPLEKDCEFSDASPGMIGLELCFPLLLGLGSQAAPCPMSRLIDALTVAPARIVGLGAAGHCRRGPCGELVMIEPETEFVIARAASLQESQHALLGAQTSPEPSC